MADKRDCLITAFKHHALNFEMDIPFRTDLIPQAAVKSKCRPYTYRLQASVVKDVCFEFFRVLFFPWLSIFSKKEHFLWEIRLNVPGLETVVNGAMTPPFGSCHLWQWRTADSFNVAIFGMIINIYTGFLEIDKEKIILIKTLGGTKKDILKKLILPGSKQIIISNMKVNIFFGLCLVGVIMRQTFSRCIRALATLLYNGSQCIQDDLCIYEHCYTLHPSRTASYLGKKLKVDSHGRETC